MHGRQCNEAINIIMAQYAVYLLLRHALEACLDNMIILRIGIKGTLVWLRNETKN